MGVSFNTGGFNVALPQKSEKAPKSEGKGKTESAPKIVKNPSNPDQSVKGAGSGTNKRPNVVDWEDGKPQEIIEHLTEVDDKINYDNTNKLDLEHHVFPDMDQLPETKDTEISFPDMKLPEAKDQEEDKE